MPENDELLDVLAQLSILEPTGTDAAPAAQTVFKRITNAPPATLPRTTKRRFPTFSVVAMFIAIACALAILPPTRALAGEFLSLFRVDKFAPISVSPQQLQLLDDLSESGLFPAEITPIGPDGSRFTFETHAEAQAHMLQVEKPAFVNTFQALGEPDYVAVEGSGDALLTINLDGARRILEAVGGDPMTLPDSFAEQAIDVRTNELVTQQWFDANIVLEQTLSPEIAYPDDVDPSVIGQALLQFLGMGSGEATRVAQAIDWTTTMVLPIPTSLGSFSEVQVNNTTGLAIEPIGVGATLIWQEDDTTYLLAGYGEETTVPYLLDLIETGQFR